MGFLDISDFVGGVGCWLIAFVGFISVFGVDWLVVGWFWCFVCFRVSFLTDFVSCGVGIIYDCWFWVGCCSGAWDWLRCI